mgnify:CR=1 FL=1
MKGIHKTGKKIEVVLTWFNYQKEQFRQCDLTLTKSIEGNALRERYIEVKATLGDTVHFFLSEGEWALMTTATDKYRLYHVFNACDRRVKYTKIPRLSEDINNNAYTVKPHTTTKYELT